MNAKWQLLVCGICAVLLGSLPTFAEQVPEPTKDLYYFVIDRSGSIGDKKLDKEFRKAVVGYVDNLKEETQVNIVFFSDSATTPRSWYPMNSDAKKAFARYFDENLKPGGQTLLYDTFAQVLNRVRAHEAEFRAITIIILSDGEDNQSKDYKSWASLEKLLPDGWAQKRKGFSVTWVLVGDPPKSPPSIDSFVKPRRAAPDGKEIEKCFAQPPKAVFTAKPVKVKENEAVLFALNDDTGVTKAKWSFGDGTTSDKKTDTHAFSKKGAYRIVVEVEGVGGTDRAEGSVEVVDVPPLNAAFSWYPVMIRSGEPVKFSDESLGSPTSWSWEFPEIGSRNDRNPLIVFAKAGKTTVTLTVEREGKRVSSHIDLEVIPPPPKAKFSPDPFDPVIGQDVNLKAPTTESGWNHKWIIGKDTVLEGAEVKWIADRLGRVEIIHSVSGLGGLVEYEDFVFVKEKPDDLVARFKWSPDEVHVGEKVVFIDESAGNPKTWAWEIPGIPVVQQHNPTTTFANPGKVTVKLIIERDGKTSEIQREIQVLPKPVTLQAIFAAKPKKGRIPLTVQFADKSKGIISSWHWEFGDGKISDVQNPLHTYEDAKSYIPRLVIRDSKGESAKDTGEITILVNPPMPMWLKVLSGLIALLLIWVILVVPFILRPLLAPQKKIAFRGTTVSFLKPIAKKCGSNIFWPCRSVTIGTGKCGSVKVGGVGQKNEYLARVSRVPATSNYELVALQANVVSEVRKEMAPNDQETKQLVPLVSGKPRLLRDQEQFEICGTVLTWVQPSRNKH